MTPERRAELRALLAKASPGPWTRWKDNLVVWSGEVTDNTPGGLSIKPDSGREIAEFPAWEIDDDGRDREAAANADLVAAAKAALPALLDALDMTEARERRLREALELIAAENHASRISSVQRAVGIARAALSEVAPDA